MILESTGITADVSSYTEDRLRPYNGFKWFDRFNQERYVKVTSSNPQVTIMFPVSNREVRFRAGDINNPGDELRTGCGAEHRYSTIFKLTITSILEIHACSNPRLTN